MTEIQSGTVLKSRYKIIQTLGKGGMGEVYLAEDQSLANQVAVKANHNLSAHTSAQFIREARLLASLKHPNLPRVIDYFIEDDSQYLVMDYVPGNDLRTLVEGKNAIMVPLVIKWAEQLGNAINYLHNQNPPIFHRDVKPANIKVTPNGEVVLVDFGIAKTGDPSQETQTGAWGYTPGFAPPEQVSGLRTGPYSDQFSLAATLYYLLAGTPPVDSAQRMMGSAVLTPIKELRKETPDHVSVAIMKAMSIKPEERFTTVADFIHALTSPTPIPDPSNTQRTVIGRARTAQPPVVPPATPPAAAEALPVPHRKSPLGLILGIIGVLVLAGGFFLLKSMGIIGAKTATTVPTPFVLVVTGEPQNTPPPIETAAATETPASAATDTPEPTATATLPAYIPIGGGGRLAFVSNRQADGYFQVWLMGVVQDTDGNLLGVNPQQLTFDEGNKSNPSWSPDGTKLLYSGLSTQVASNKKPFADDIWMLDLTQPDAAPVDLTNKVGDDKYATWSPNGKWIAWTSFGRDDKVPMLNIMNSDGTDQRQLSDLVGEQFTAWAFDSDYLMYVTIANSLKMLHMRDKFNSFKDDHKFDQFSVAGRLGLVWEPAVSRDGTLIVYTALEGSKTNIWLAPYADRGAVVTQLTKTGLDSTASFSPDSKWVVFTSRRDGDDEIYIMDTTGALVTNLTAFPSQDRDPAWQPAALP